MIMDIAEIDTPIGRLTLVVHDRRVCALAFPEHWPRARARLERRFGRVDLRRASDPADVVSRLQDYFAGRLDALAAIEVDTGGTLFQQTVWRALRAVPGGRTVSYGALARTIGAPGAVRAVGAANGANPVAIVIPCHRVIGSDGTLTGYGGGLHRKRWLLAHEADQLRFGCVQALSRPTDRPRPSTVLGGEAPLARDEEEREHHAHGNHEREGNVQPDEADAEPPRLDNHPYERGQTEE
jgi:methylated-DNA-[protein]-cysteine S-methyltransferase